MKLGVVLALISLLFLIVLWHHRPAETEDPVHYFDSLEEASWEFQRQVDKYEGAFIIGIREVSDSMGWGSSTEWYARAVLVPWPLDKMPHRSIGGFYRPSPDEAPLRVIHRYYRLRRGVYSVSGDANRGPDEMITEKTHAYKVVFVGLWPIN